MSRPVKRTYGSRQAKPVLRSSSPLESPSSPPKPSLKRPLKERLSFTNQPTKRPRLERSSDASSSKQKPKHDAKPSQTLTQLHFSIDTTVLRTCALCDLTYTKGAPDDENLHKSHCSRVQKGMEWGREEEKESVKMGVQEIASSVKLKNGKKGRIICVKATAGGRIGSKLAILFETISLTLSSPPLTPEILAASKVYLFLLPSPVSASREKIVGCVIAQHITSAMEIAAPSDIEPPASPDTPPLTATLVPVDTSSGLFCHPKLLPTPLGIPRLFVPSTYRRQGIAALLLNAAAETFVHGCRLNPKQGDVAFTQPTESGRAIMESWGGGGVRIYQE
ncbi:hypothetical protein DENSPDRAFT_841568 [Dentipellis sp. KUC8613]|nr:hypothetical protein DENSPDRAFT_841568 [Dentipellis sp. KUC8613]